MMFCSKCKVAMHNSTGDMCPDCIGQMMKRSKLINLGDKEQVQR